MERFWNKVAKRASGCWEWTGNRHRQGYGFFKIGTLNKLAHRVAYSLHHGVELQRHNTLLHICDNPCCVNPAHLLLGTQAMNVQDMARKGRHRGTSLLTDEQVRSIRIDPRKGTTIEAEMGLAAGTVSRIKSRKIYARVIDI